MPRNHLLKYTRKKWIALSLFWLPLALLTTCLGIDLLPRGPFAWSRVIYLGISATVLLVWLFAEILERIYNQLVDLTTHMKVIGLSFFVLGPLFLLALAATAFWGILRGVEGNWFNTLIFIGIVGVSCGSGGLDSWKFETAALPMAAINIGLAMAGITGITQSGVAPGVLFAVIWYIVATTVDKTEARYELGNLLLVVMMIPTIALIANTSRTSPSASPDLLAGIVTSMTLIVMDKIHHRNIDA